MGSLQDIPSPCMQKRVLTPSLKSLRSSFPVVRSPEDCMPIPIPDREPIPVFYRNSDAEVGVLGMEDAFDIYMSSLSDNYSSNNSEIVTSEEPHLLKLPLKVRFLIYEFLTEFERTTIKKIILSPQNTVAYFWPDDSFIVPSDILDFIRDASETCWQLRDEITTFYCTQFHFHITYNYFCTSFVARIIHKWLPLFANRIQYLTVEADFTRLGGSYKNGACALPSGQKEIIVLVDKLLDDMSDRQGSVQSLHIMCRRYKGKRPLSQDKLPSHVDPVKYCPNSVTHILENLTHFIGPEGTPVRHVRLTGFPNSYTNDILSFVATDELDIEFPDFDPWPAVDPAEIPLPETPVCRSDSPTAHRFIGSSVRKLTTGGTVYTPSRLSIEAWSSDTMSPFSSSCTAQSIKHFGTTLSPCRASFDLQPAYLASFGLGFDMPGGDDELRLTCNVQADNVETNNVDIIQTGNVQTDNIETDNVRTDNVQSDNVQAGNIQTDNADTTQTNMAGNPMIVRSMRWNSS